MKLSFDKDADALTIVLKNDKIVRDEAVSENLFAGFSKSGELAQVQILEISNSEGTWLTVDLVAKIIGKSERTVLRWIEKGALPAKKVGKEYRIKPEYIEDLAS